MILDMYSSFMRGDLLSSGAGDIVMSENIIFYNRFTWQW